MNDQFKKVNNPLFSAAVTGATLEEFSQNAILLPAKEKITSSPLKLSQGIYNFTVIAHFKLIYL